MVEPTGWFGASWRDVALAAIAAAVLVALLCLDDSACRVRISTTDPATTREVERG